ncbi:MAG: EamA family transporter [Candidatus Dojkabacteria bacterium]
MEIIFGLLAAFFSGSAYVLFKRSGQSDSKKYISQALFCFLGFNIYLLFFNYSFDFKINLFLIAVLSALLAEALPLYALQRGKLAVNSAIFSAYPVFTIIFSFFINSESVTSLQLLFVGIIIVSISILSFLGEKGDNNSLQGFINLSVIWAIVAAIATGFSDSISKYFINETSTMDFLFALALAQIPVAFSLYFFEQKSFSGMFKLDKYTSLGGIFMTLSLIFFWYALTLGVTGIISSVASVAAVIAIVLSIIFLKEKISRIQFFLTAITLIAVTFLAVIA